MNIKYNLNLKKHNINVILRKLVKNFYLKKFFSLSLQFNVKQPNLNMSVPTKIYLGKL